MPAGFSAEHRPRERYLTVEELQKLLPQLLPEKTAVVAFIIATAADWSAVGRALRADVAIDGTGCTIRGSKNEYPAQPRRADRHPRAADAHSLRP